MHLRRANDRNANIWDPAFQKCVDAFKDHQTIRVVRVDALGSLGLKDAPRHYSGVRLCRKRPNDEYPDGQPKCRWFLGGDSIKRVRADEAGESPALVDFDTPHSSSPTCSFKRRHVNSRLRHYRVNIAFVFHAIELGLTTVRYCKTAHMRADFLTKALPVGAFRANAALVYPDYEYAPL